MQDRVTRERMETGVATADGADPASLSGWVRKLGDSGMPVFAHTAQDIARVSESRESSASELARVVLQDAAMTAKLLRVANSPIFNPVGRTISTVSRAVVVLGFEEVRSICLSIAVVESMLRGKQKQRVVEEMARSFHAAVQARSFARKRKDGSPEEVFIATLLYRLGDLAFWAFAGESAGRMDAVLQQRPGESPEKVQREVLGFPLRELTLGLSREWKLGGLLEQSLDGSSGRNPRVSNVVLGHELAEAAEKGGWEAPEVTRLLERIAENLYLPVEEVVELVRANAEEAVRTASFYGAGAAGCLIPQAGDDATDAAHPGEETEVNEFPQPDPLLQLGILRELSLLMESSPDANSVLEMVLEGMYRGIGMDRTLFALRTPDHRLLVGRYALGRGNEELRRQFSFETLEETPNLLQHAIASKQALWVGRETEEELSRLLTPQLLELSRGADFFIMPIEIHGRVIGIFYADRQPSGRPLDEDSFTSFRHFVQQANLALSFINSD